MTNSAELQAAADRVIEQVSRTGLNSLSQHDRVIFLAWGYAGVVDNGGFPAFFYNSQADYYPETLDALRLLGPNTFADLLERAGRLLFPGKVPRSMDERNAIIDELPETRIPTNNLTS